MNIGIRDDGCPSGDALLYPATGTPVRCSNIGQSSCPRGYRCIKNANTGDFQCCTIPEVRHYEGNSNAFEEITIQFAY